MKAAQSLKLEIISCKLAATERCEVATDQREVTLSACLQLPACSQIKQTHYMKLRRTMTKTRMTAEQSWSQRQTSSLDDNIKPVKYWTPLSFLYQQDPFLRRDLHTRLAEVPWYLLVKQQGLHTMLWYHQAFHAQPKNKWDPFDSVTCTVDLPQKRTKMKASHDLQHLSFLSLIYHQRTKKSTVLLRIMRGFKTIPGS